MGFKVQLLCYGKGGVVTMGFIVCVGEGLVML